MSDRHRSHNVDTYHVPGGHVVDTTRSHTVDTAFDAFSALLVCDIPSEDLRLRPQPVEAAPDAEERDSLPKADIDERTHNAPDEEKHSFSAVNGVITNRQDRQRDRAQKDEKQQDLADHLQPSALSYRVIASQPQLLIGIHLAHEPRVSRAARSLGGCRRRTRSSRLAASASVLHRSVTVCGRPVSVPLPDLARGVCRTPDLHSAPLCLHGEPDWLQFLTSTASSAVWRISLAGLPRRLLHDTEVTGYVLLALPIGVQEMVFALWLMIKGCARAPLAAGDTIPVSEPVPSTA